MVGHDAQALLLMNPAAQSVLTDSGIYSLCTGAISFHYPLLIVFALLAGKVLCHSCGRCWHWCFVGITRLLLLQTQAMQGCGSTQLGLQHASITSRTIEGQSWGC